MKEIDDNLLTEFLEGKLDEPANREIENWYDASEENRRRLEALYFVLFAETGSVPPRRSTPTSPSDRCSGASNCAARKQGPNGGRSRRATPPSSSRA